MFDPEYPKQPWSATEFLLVLSDQALLAGNRELFLDEGWPTAEIRQRFVERNAYWLFPLVPVMVGVMFDECSKGNGRVVVHPSFLAACDPGMTNMVYRMVEQSPFFSEHFGYLTLDWATRALCGSPLFVAEFEIKRHGRPFKFWRQNGDMCLEHAAK